MKSKLFISIITLILGINLFVNLVVAEKTLLLMFTVHKDNSITIEGIEYHDVSLILPKSGDYRIEILDKNEEVIYSIPFDVKFLILTEPPTETNESTIYMRLPWKEKYFTVNFYHSNNLLHTLNLSNYLCDNNNKCEVEKGESEYLCPEDCEKPVTCGDGTCQENETYESCPQDCPKLAECGNKKCESGENQNNCCLDCGCPSGKECVNNVCQIVEKCGNGVCDKNENYGNCPKDCPSGSKDGYCDKIEDGVCDPDCSRNEDNDCKEPKEQFPLWITIVIIIILIVLIMLIKRYKEQRELNRILEEVDREKYDTK